MNVSTREPTILMSDFYNSLRGIAWNFVLLLFAGIWLMGAAYTLYSLFTNVGEMSFLWLVISLALLAVWGIIAGIGTTVSIIGVYDHTKSLVSGTSA